MGLKLVRRMFAFHGAVVLKTNSLPSRMPTSGMATTTMDTNRVMMLTIMRPMHKILTCKTTMDTLVMAIMSSSSSSHRNISSNHNSSHRNNPHSSHRNNPHSSDHRGDDYLCGFRAQPDYQGAECFRI